MNTYEVLDNELETQYSILIKAHERKEKQRYNFILFVLFITLVAVGASVFFSYKAFAATQKSKPEEEVKVQEVDKKALKEAKETLLELINGVDDE